jgi:hypothetical protein
LMGFWLETNFTSITEPKNFRDLPFTFHLSLFTSSRGAS